MVVAMCVAGGAALVLLRQRQQATRDRGLAPVREIYQLGDLRPAEELSSSDAGARSRSTSRPAINPLLGLSPARQNLEMQQWLA